MTLKTLKLAAKACEDSLKELVDALDVLKGKKADDPFYGIVCDAVIKRFEVAFEYGWKLMKVAVEYQGIEAAGPRPAIQEAIRFGYIAAPEFWARALDSRNASVHDYLGIPIGEYLKIIGRFSKELALLIENVKKIS